MKYRRYPGLWNGRARVGAWAFLLHRISGIIIALYGIAHVLVMSASLRGEESFNRLMEAFHKPWVIALEQLLIIVVLYHICNGLRVSLFDLGVATGFHRELFWILFGISLAGWGVFLYHAYPHIIGGLK